MVWTISVILVVLWLLGMASSYTLGGFIHLLPVAAVIAILVRWFASRKRDLFHFRRGDLGVRQGQPQGSGRRP